MHPERPRVVEGEFFRMFCVEVALFLFLEKSAGALLVYKRKSKFASPIRQERGKSFT